MLKTVHDLVAFQTGAEAFRLTPEECEFIASPALAVLKYHGFDLPAGYGVWGNLLVALATVYAPRVSAVLGITSEHLPRTSTNGANQAPQVVDIAPQHDFMGDLQGALSS